MELRDKNPVAQALMIRLKKQAAEKQAPVWRAVASGLNRPRSRQHTVSLYQLDRRSGPVVVPGVVLSNGQLTRPLTISAFKFTAAARQKIEKAGGTCLSLEEGMQKYPDGKGLRLIG